MDTALAKLADEAADCNNERFTCMIELKVGLLLVAGFEIIFFFSMGYLIAILFPFWFFL